MQNVNKIPPLIAVHAIISDGCREDHGDAGALQEAFSRIAKEYATLCDIHRLGKDVKFHVRLDVEFPTV